VALVDAAEVGIEPLPEDLQPVIEQVRKAPDKTDAMRHLGRI
jgi:hypothetical protein